MQDTNDVDPSTNGQRARKRSATPVSSLSTLVGAHPDALRQMYEDGHVADPGELGDAPRGRLLALEPGSELFLLTRPVVRALGKDLLPWRGKTFDHGGNSGQNVVLGKRVFRFRTEVGPSEVDGQPTLVLRYDGGKNPWPVSAIVDELRGIGEGIAIGPAYLAAGGKKRLLLWWGLERA
jgi:hypothetical protein